MTKFIKFSIFALTIATLWCAIPRYSHARAAHACSCACCAHGACQNCCPQTDDATHTVEYPPLSAGSSDTCSCKNSSMPISENAVAVIDRDIEKIKKTTVVAFYPAAGPAAYERCVTFAKIQSIHIPTVQQLYILNASLLL